MRDYLIVLNYQREVPPFMISQLKYGSRHFKRVYYVTRSLVNDNFSAVQAGNAELVQAGSARDPFIAVSSIIGGMLHGGLSAYVGALMQGRLDSAFIKSQVPVEAGAHLLCRAASPLIAQLGAENCVVLATWFSTEAWAAVQLKQRFSALKAVSFAHSFEVQKKRDPQLDLRHIRERHEGLDAVYFISETVLDTYRAEYISPLGISDKSSSVHYLGSEPGGVGFGPSNDGAFRLLTCSGILPVKRLALLVDGLAALDADHAALLHWTHIGAGPLESEVKRAAMEKLGLLGDVDFRGYMPNAEVRGYYEQNPCDLFVNVSSMEGLPVSLMECMCYGVPALATDVGGSREVVLDGVSGRLLPEDPTPAEIAAGIKDFMDMPQFEMMTMRAKCCEVWAERFDVSKNADSFYSALCGGNE